MMNTALLKQTLSEKVAAQNINTIANTTQNDVAERVAVNLPPPTLSLVLTFPVALGEAQEQFERIQSLIATLKLQSEVQYQVRPALATPIRPTGLIGISTSGVTAAPKCQTLGPVENPLTARPTAQQALHSSTATPPSPLSMTEKQRAMILALTSRKKLSTKAVEVILQREFGHTDGAALNKRDASRLIDRLMSM